MSHRGPQKFRVGDRVELFLLSTPDSRLNGSKGIVQEGPKFGQSPCGAHEWRYEVKFTAGYLST